MNALFTMLAIALALAFWLVIAVAQQMGFLTDFPFVAPLLAVFAGLTWAEAAEQRLRRH